MEDQTHQYLKQLLTTFEPCSPSSEDEKLIGRSKSQFIVNKLTRKKFRKRKLIEKTRQAIVEKVDLSLNENRPLHFVIPFGGYKHFWNPSHPEPDWAEVFNFKYLTDFVSPALCVHEQGVIIEYVSEDMILTRMNNYPQKALDAYSEIFAKLIDWYNKLTPNNLTFKYVRVGDKCDKAKIIDKVEQLLPERLKAFNNLSQEEKAQELHRSNRSMLWNGDKDLTSLSDSEKSDRIIESRLIELAFYDTEGEEEFMGAYYSEDNHVCICFSFGTTHDNDSYEDLTLGSTYGSIVDHWIGRGILRKREDRFIPDIISRNQYEELGKNYKEIPVKNILPFKNYHQIEVVEER